jgi:hypothetical protein
VFDLYLVRSTRNPSLILSNSRFARRDDLTDGNLSDGTMVSSRIHTGFLR